jgi:hypothetical protein
MQRTALHAAADAGRSVPFMSGHGEEQHMADHEHPIWDTIAIDHHNVTVSRQGLTHYGLMALLESVPPLFTALPREVVAAAQSAGRTLFERVNIAGNRTPAWDFLLQIVMTQSASMQFLHATGHLLRGHTFELFGHARTMIENAGVAYLTRSTPELGELYFNQQDTEAFARRTCSGRILPVNDPLTQPLNHAFKVASQIFHSNLVAVVGRMNFNLREEGDRLAYEHLIAFHDAKPQDHAGFLRNAAWLIQITGQVLRLLGASFALPDCIWYRRLEQFEVQMDHALQRIRPIIDPPP